MIVPNMLGNFAEMNLSTISFQAVDYPFLKI